MTKAPTTRPAPPAREQPTNTQIQDALERWQARCRLWDLEDAGGFRYVMEHLDDPRPPLHQPWATP